MIVVQIRVDLTPFYQIRRSCLEAKSAILIVPTPSWELLSDTYYKAYICEQVPSPFRSKRRDNCDITVKTLDPSDNIMNVTPFAQRCGCCGHNRATFDEEGGYFG